MSVRLCATAKSAGPLETMGGKRNCRAPLPPNTQKWNNNPEENHSSNLQWVLILKQNKTIKFPFNRMWKTFLISSFLKKRLIFPNDVRFLLSFISSKVCAMRFQLRSLFTFHNLLKANLILRWKRKKKEKHNSFFSYFRVKFYSRLKRISLELLRNH